MASLVRLPKLGANIVEGAVGRWRKREGEPVRVTEPLVEIITSKATFELESPADGILRRQVAPEKSAIPVGYVVAIVGAPDEPLPDVAPENDRLLREFQSQAKPEAPAADKPARSVRATPGARRLAKESGLDLSSVPFPAGRDVLREEDVREFLAQNRGR